MTNTSRNSNPPSASFVTVRRAKNVLIGGFAGLVVGVGILFILTMLYGKATGLAPIDCLLASCTLTLLLSQPMGVAGMTAGAIIGAMTGAMVHHNRHLRPR